MSLASIPFQESKQQPRRTVLICDDEQDVLATYQRALSKSYNVITALTGQECLAKYSEQIRKGNKIDVALLDFRVGDMTGDKIAYKIKKINGSGTKVILITAYELDAGLLAKLKEGKCIASHIRKPVSPKVLLDKVAHIINNLENKSEYVKEEKEKIVDAMMAALDEYLGANTSYLLFKTLKLVYKIDEDQVRAQPGLLQTMLAKLLGEDTVRLILRKIRSEEEKNE